MSLPSRVNMGCGATRTSISASPLGPCAGPGIPLPLESDRLPVIDSGGDGDVDRCPAVQGQSSGPALGSFQKGDLHGVAPVAASRADACTAALPARAEQRRNDVVGVETAESEVVEPKTFERAGSGALSGARVGIGVLMLHALVARGVDLAAVITTPRLCIPQDLVGGRDFLEPLCGPGISRMAIGVKLHGQIAISRLDVVLARVASDSKDLI